MLKLANKEVLAVYKAWKIMHGRAILTTILLRVSTSSDDMRLTFFEKKPIRIMTMIETMIILKSMQSTNKINLKNS